ncbi:MAG: YceI family protein [Bdellovibrionota bacterium]
MKSFITSLALTIAASAAFAAPATYTIDKDHSNVQFSVRHLMITDVSGRFKDFEGTFTFDGEKASVTDATFSADTASIDTSNAKRDDHLRSADFFDAKKHPKLTLTNSKIAKTGKDTFKWNADLTMHGVTKPVVFDLVHKGDIKDAWGNQRAGFHATGKVNRKDYGLTWNKALEGGGVTVGDEVTITLDVSAIQKAAAPTGPAAAQAPAAAPSKKK